MTSTMSESAIERGTRKSWADWMSYFEGIGADGLSHKEIAAKVGDDFDVGGWWAQTVTVAYEQHIGRRVPGQDCEGEFSVSVSKTLHESMDDALNCWLGAVNGHEEFSEIPLADEPDISKTDKWRYWRARLDDGSRPSVHIYEKEPGKSSLTILHEKLESPDQIEHWRAYWKQFLKDASAA